MGVEEALGCEISAPGPAHEVLATDPTTRETTARGVYVGPQRVREVADGAAQPSDAAL